MQINYRSSKIESGFERVLLYLKTNGYGGSWGRDGQNGQDGNDGEERLAGPANERDTYTSVSQSQDQCHPLRMNIESHCNSLTL